MTLGVMQLGPTELAFHPRTDIYFSLRNVVLYQNYEDGQVKINHYINTLCQEYLDLIQWSQLVINMENLEFTFP
jgi:hypothetical protein